MKLIEQLRDKNSWLHNLIMYALIGIISSGLDFTIFTLGSTVLGFPWLFVNIVSVTCGITVSFFLNRRYNFRVFDHPGIRAVLFFAVGFTGLILSELVLFWLTSLALPLLWAKFLSLIMVGFVQFCLNRLLSFGIHFDS